VRRHAVRVLSRHFVNQADLPVCGNVRLSQYAPHTADPRDCTCGCCRRTRVFRLAARRQTAFDRLWGKVRPGAILYPPPRIPFLVFV
jgi:hypothetical protein